MAKADAHCEEILAQASDEAKKMKEKLIQDAKAEAAAVMDAARKEGKETAEKAAQETDEIIRALKEEAGKKTQAAVSDVISHLI